MTPRSYLYVPGDAEHKLSRARQRGADAVIIDLEDAVTAAARPAARQQAHAILAQSTPTEPSGPAAGGEMWVRVNPPPEMAVDIDAVVAPGVTGVVVAKAEPESLAEADRLLAAAEERHGLPHGQFAIIALIETAQAVLAAAAIARAPRVIRLGLGEADLIGDLGLQPSDDRRELLPIRLQIVLASAAAGIQPPVGPVETHLGDDQRLLSSTQALRALGFRARTAIHPRQIGVINDVFTPSAAEVERARATIAALAAAQAQGSGAALTGQGHFVDAAVARSAHQTLATYESLNTPQ